MRSSIVRADTSPRVPTLLEWEQKPGETAEEYAAFMRYATHDDPAMSPLEFCEANCPELIPVASRLLWSSRRNALIEYRGIVTGLRAKQSVYKLLNETVDRIGKIEGDVYEVIDRAGAMSDEGAAALQVFFRCAELASRLTNAINDKAMRINVVTQVNASLPSLSREWDDPGDTIIDGDG